VTSLHKIFIIKNAGSSALLIFSVVTRGKTKTRSRMEKKNSMATATRRRFWRAGKGESSRRRTFHDRMQEGVWRLSARRHRSVRITCAERGIRHGRREKGMKKLSVALYNISHVLSTWLIINTS